jgi:hypothetical protein
MGRENKRDIVHCGRVITTKELANILETVVTCSSLSRNELALTVGEHLEWYSATGSLKVDACAKLLEKLEAQGFLSLPVKQQSSGRGRKHTPQTNRTEAEELLEGSVGNLGPFRVLPVTEKEEIALWNEYVSRYHYLGYKHPFGCHQRYFITSEQGNLGCLLFSGAAKALRERDKWFGWSKDERLRNLGFVINNSRFLMFPWVKVKYLASHALGQAVRRLGDDWERRWGYRPVVVETFVDPERYAGTCYRAANWLYLGQTTGTGLARIGKSYTSSPKQIFVMPLVTDFRTVLCSGGTMP